MRKHLIVVSSLEAAAARGSCTPFIDGDRHHADVAAEDGFLLSRDEDRPGADDRELQSAHQIPMRMTQQEPNLEP